MKELTKSELIKVIRAINYEGMDNSQWLTHRVFSPDSVDGIFGGKDGACAAVTLEVGEYLAVYYGDENRDDFPMFDRMLADIIEDKALEIGNLTIFLIDGGEQRIKINK